MAPKTHKMPSFFECERKSKECYIPKLHSNQQLAHKRFKSEFLEIAVKFLKLVPKPAKVGFPGSSVLWADVGDIGHKDRLRPALKCLLVSFKSVIAGEDWSRIEV